MEKVAFARLRDGLLVATLVGVHSRLSYLSAILFLIFASASVSLWRNRWQAARAECLFFDRQSQVTLILAGGKAPGGGWRAWRAARVENPGASLLPDLRAYALPGTHPGFELRWHVRLVCRMLARNPGRLEDGCFLWRWPTLRVVPLGPGESVPTAAPIPVRFQARFDRFLAERLGRHPTMEAIARAVWQGDFSGFPGPLRQFYQEAGLAAVLALSGQHVGLLVCFSRWVLWPLRWVLFRFRPFDLRWPFSLLDIFAATLLFLTSQAAAPMQRTLAHSAARAWVATRGFRVGGIQIATTSVALLFLWNPGLLSSPGFLLSALGSVGLAVLVSGAAKAEGGVRQYLLIAAVLPILSFPLTAFLFGRVAWDAPFHQVLLSWIWSLLWIPLGFALPVLALLPSGLLDAVSLFFSGVWAKFLEWNLTWVQQVGSGSSVAVRLTWFPTLLAELLLLGILAWFRMRFLK